MVAIQLAPQANPEGQHPAPALAAQLYHPPAQLSWLPVSADAGVVVLVIATTVSPEVATTDALADGGQDVVSQFLSTWQHPPK